MKLHHIGYVVKDIVQYEKSLIFEKKVKELFDPVQNSKMALYENYSDSFIELIQPLNEESFTYNFLQKNGSSYHHLCYEVGVKRRDDGYCGSTETDHGKRTDTCHPF